MVVGELTLETDLAVLGGGAAGCAAALRAAELGMRPVIVNPNGAVADAKGKDFSWDLKGLKRAAHVGKDFWSLEVFFPYSAFPEARKPTDGTGVTWHGNFTRHRVADQGRAQGVPEAPRRGRSA